MAEKQDSGDKKEFDPEERFRYVGFDVHQGKIKDLFESSFEKDSWVNKVLEKRKKGSKLREVNSFDQPRVEGYEKIILAVTSLLLVVSLFMPWFTGYTEYEVKAEVPAEEIAMIDSSMVDSLSDSLSLVAGESAEPIDENAELVSAEDIATETEMAGTTESDVESKVGATYVLEKDDIGFASITAIQIRKEIKRDYEKYSAIGVVGMLGSLGGSVFSSGFVLMLTAFLFLIYMLLCVGSAGYTIYTLFGIKGDADTQALKLKKALRVNWIPIGIWGFCMILSFFGAGYSFDSSGLMKQIGNYYGIATYLGILGYGFYISLACFIMNAVKAVEI